MPAPKVPFRWPGQLLLLISLPVLCFAGLRAAGPAALDVPDVVGASSYEAYVRLLQGYFKSSNITLVDAAGVEMPPDKGRIDVVTAISVSEPVTEDSTVTLTLKESVTIDPASHIGEPGGTVRDYLDERGLPALIFVDDDDDLAQCEGCSSKTVKRVYAYSAGAAAPPVELAGSTSVPVGTLMALVVNGTPPPVPTTLTVPSGLLGQDLRDGYMALRRAGFPHGEVADRASTIDPQVRAVGHNEDGEPLVLFSNDPSGQMLGLRGRISWVFPAEGASITIDSTNSNPDVLMMSMEQISVPVNSLLNQPASTVAAALQDMGLNPIYYYHDARVLYPCTVGMNCQNRTTLAIGYFPLGPGYPPTTEPPNTLAPLSVGDLVAVVVPASDGD